MQSIVDLIIDEELAAGLTAIKNHDEYTFHCGTCRSCPSPSARGRASKKMLGERVAALLHDLGKASIPPGAQQGGKATPEWKLWWTIRSRAKMIARMRG